MTERDSHALDRDRRGNRGVTLSPPAVPLNRQMEMAGSGGGAGGGVDPPIAAPMRLQVRPTGPYQILAHCYSNSRPAGLRPPVPTLERVVSDKAAGTGAKSGTPPSSIALIWRRFDPETASIGCRFDEEAAFCHGTPRVPSP